jgi:WhiB family redox-sensing transcriptional regulator
VNTLARTAVPEWQERGLCAQTDPDAFYPELGKPSAPAKRICRNCEVQQQCLEFALANNEEFGIWGGTTERERRALKKKATA